MKIWFDLIANPNSKLGILEGNSENTIMPDVTRRVAKFIAQKYDPEVGSRYLNFILKTRMSQLSWSIQTSSFQVRLQISVR